MNYILFDDEARQSLLPLTHTRPVAEIRIGILKIREKWELHLKGDYSFLTEQFLSEKYKCVSGKENVFINGSVFPSDALKAEIEKLGSGEKLMKNDVIVAGRLDGEVSGISSIKDVTFNKTSNCKSEIVKINFSWDIFALNEAALTNDYNLLTKNRISLPISPTNKVISPERVFLEEGAKAECAILNASSGFIYIGKDAEVMEGAMIRGPFALGEHSQVKMGAKIYGATTIGPHSKVGGEISNSVVFGYTNKAHDGFLGNSVLGEWCNLGADSNNSNLKNNYSKIKVWNYKEETYINSGLQFCGLIMGDHSKCSINTMFNTGTVVGVSANIFGNGFPPKFVPSFAWGGSEGFITYRLEDALEVAQRVYERRHIDFDNTEQDILRNLFENTTKYRAW
jgi:UDP-N-acetylglucosamine diphosphorylase/glucosamine-1-phosphate N-acetyltransferase